MGEVSGGEVTVAAGRNAMVTWLNAVQSQRDAIVDAAISGNAVLATLSEAEARADLIEAMGTVIRDKLLRMTQPHIRMVELVNNPTDDDRVHLTAYALLGGLKPGAKQFGIFGGGRERDGSPRPGTLYIKANGYRQLFAYLGIAPQVKPGIVRHSSELDGRSRPVWICEGEVSCFFNGKEYSRVATAESPILIAGHNSDKVEAVQGKLKTRLLRELYEMVSPLMQDAAGESDGDIIEGAIEVESRPVVAKADPLRQYPEPVVAILQKYEAAGKPDAVAYLHSMAEMISAADSAEELQKISDDVNANYKAAGIARADLKPIAEWRDQIAASMAEAS